MATILLDDAGSVVRYVHAMIEPDGPLPAHAAVFEFDSATNPALVTVLQQRPASVLVVGGQVTVDGVVVTVAANGRELRDKLFAMEKLAELEADGVLSDAHQDRVLRFVLRWIARQG